MSIIGILSSNLFSGGAAQNTQSTQNTQNTPSTFQQIKAEFQQLGQDLQSGNLSQAQQDFSALSQSLPSTSQSGGNPVLQALNQLGKDLQAGNLQAAQQDYSTVQQDAQQIAAQLRSRHGHHHHAAENSESSSSSNSSSSQQANPIVQAFTTLAQDLQAGNLSGAQAAFATLQNDLQQIGGFVTGGSNGVSATAAATSGGSLNVSA